jgi:hypothetical protein
MGFLRLGGGIVRVSAVSTLATQLEGLFGPSITVASATAQTGITKAYEEAFTEYAEQFWTQDGTAVYGSGGLTSGESGGNYYDRALIWYMWYARTGNATYLSRADAQAQAYSDYCTATGLSNVQAYRYFARGLYAHYLSTGNTTSKAHLATMATVLKANIDNVSWLADGDSRDRARILNSFLWAYKSGDTSFDWSAYIVTTIGRLEALQATDGSWPVTNLGSATKPFMVGVLCDTLIDCYNLHNADSRIPPMVKKSIDFLWNNTWIYRGISTNNTVDHGAAFKYVTPPWTNEPADTPAPDLNGLIVNAAAWYYAYSGNAAYLSRAQAILAGLLSRAGWEGTHSSASKQFNEGYNASYRALSWMGAGAANIPGHSRVPTPHDVTGTGWGGSASASKPGGSLLAPDGVTQAARVTLSGTGSVRTCQIPWPQNTTGLFRIIAKKAPTSGAANFYLTINDRSNAATALSQKFDSVTGGSNLDGTWRVFDMTGNMAPGVTNSFVDIEIGDRDAAGTADATCAGALDVAFVFVSPGAAAPDFTPNAISFSGGQFTVSGINTPVPIEVTGGTFSVNGGPSRGASDVVSYLAEDETTAKTSPYVVVNGDVVTASSGATVTIGRVPGVSAGVSAANP